tara:strand:+ start:66582 stop:67490 length:909 start_codon:yes stop_codon:yes gene_type:complete
MELDKTKSWPYYALGASILFIIILGGWWLYLVFTLAIKLKEMNSPILQGNLVMMVQWEGVTFLGITIFVGIALLYIFYQDSKKSHATQAFYASLTHELKTPLASMRLQAQVLSDMVQKIACDRSEVEKIEKYSQRLEQDSIRLENEIDRHLHLSRLELKGYISLDSLNPVSLIKSAFKSYPQLQLEITEGDFSVLADQSAFLMIIKNLIENTLRHQSQAKKVSIIITNEEEYIKLTYDDHGSAFNGDISKLGSLFYKHQSPKGSGIGLYLIKKIMKNFGGRLSIRNSEHLIFDLYFKRGDNE